MDPVTLRTQRLLLRPWRSTDVAPLAELFGDPRVREFYPRTLERSESEVIATRMRTNFERDGYGMWAVELLAESNFIGYIGLQMVPFEAHFTPALEIGWQLAPHAWGKGLATEGARATLAFAHDELGREEVIAMTSHLNKRSWRVMEKLEMTRDPRDDFEVPVIPEGHRLRRHVLYRHRVTA